MSGILDKVLSSVPEGFFDAFVETLKTEYGLANELSQRHPDERIRHQYLRRGQVEAGDIALQRACNMFGDIKIGKTRYDSYYFYHAMLPSCTLSVNRKPQQKRKLRKAVFRRNLAYTNQLFLSPSLIPEGIEAPYIMLCHGPKLADITSLGFVEISLPISSEAVAERKTLFLASPNDIAHFAQKQYLDVAVPTIKAEILATEISDGVKIEKDLPDAKPRLKIESQSEVV